MVLCFLDLVCWVQYEHRKGKNCPYLSPVMKLMYLPVTSLQKILEDAELPENGPVQLAERRICSPAGLTHTVCELFSQHQHRGFLFCPYCKYNSSFLSKKKVSFSMKNLCIGVVFFIMFPWGVSSAFP